MKLTIVIFALISIANTQDSNEDLKDVDGNFVKRDNENPFIKTRIQTFAKKDTSKVTLDADVPIVTESTKRDADKKQLTQLPFEPFCCSLGLGRRGLEDTVKVRDTEDENIDLAVVSKRQPALIDVLSGNVKRDTIVVSQDGVLKREADEVNIRDVDVPIVTESVKRQVELNKFAIESEDSSIVNKRQLDSSLPVRDRRTADVITEVNKRDLDVVGQDDKVNMEPFTRDIEM